MYKSIISIKAGNAIVISPHPNAKNCIIETAKVICEAARKAGAPEGIVQCITLPTMEATDALLTLGLIDKNINWLGDERFALGCIILILLTTSVGQPIVLYVSALGNVDQSIVEAAEVDGATDFQCFWKIKWPAIMPTTLYILVITTINSFQCFALIQLLTSGGPNHSTDTIMYYIYYTAFKLYRYGYGNAMGVVLAIIIAILSAIQFKVGNQNN